MQHSPTLSIVLPIYNEEENLRELHAEIVKALEPLDIPFEILMIDDGSKDTSLAVIKELASQDERVRFLAFAKNCGQSAAFAAGFQGARGEKIITMDADLQNDPADVGNMLKAWDAQGADMVIGRRKKRMDSWIKRISSKVGNGVRNWLTSETVSDTGCSLKIMRADMARRIPMFTGMHRFLPTLMKMEGAKVVEVDVNHRPRLHGSSKYGTIDRAIAGAKDLLAVRWMQKRHINYSIKEHSPE